MQPSQYGTSAPDQPSPESPADDRPKARRPGARIGVVVLTAVLVELVLIGGGANDWVGKQMAKADREPRLYLDGWLTYTWRFTPPHGATKAWGAQFALIGTVVVLTAALVWALLRGPVTWGRAFFGTWLAVVFASLVGGLVRGLIEPLAGDQSGTSRVTRALFGVTGPNSLVVFGGLVLGLLVALVTSVVAVATRRPANAGAPVDPGPPSFPDYAPPPPSYRAAGGAPPPWQDQHFGPPRAPAAEPRGMGAAPDQPTTHLPPVAPVQAPSDGPERRPATDEQPTTHLGAPASGEPTTQLPPPASGEPTTQLPPSASGESTTQLPPPASGEPTTQLPLPGDRPPTTPPPAGRATPPPAGDQPTTQPPPPAGDQPTQPPAGHQPTTQPPPPAGDQATTRFPRPPDDEELGHIDH